MKYIKLLILLVIVAACTPSTPNGILAKENMENILYDMHLAQSIYENREGGISTEEELLALKASVLNKHGVSEAVWDSSFNYYCRNSRDLYAIYQSLSARIENNVIALGGKVDGLETEAAADTANVWNAEPSFILMQQAPYNIFSFDILPDSTFEDGDRITLQYDVQFIFQDGMRDVATLLVAYYDNDSTAIVTTHSNSDGHGIATINNDVDRLHVKRIKGYFLLTKNLTQNTSNANASTMRLAAIRNVKLLHLHTLPPALPEEEKIEETDSLKNDSLFKDSIMNSHVTVKNPSF